MENGGAVESLCLREEIGEGYTFISMLFLDLCKCENSSVKLIVYEKMETLEFLFFLRKVKLQETCRFEYYL